MNILICPVCGNGLEISEKRCFCPQGHSFDIAGNGYVNLLLSKHIGKQNHGDNKLMVRARRDFLGKGYYSPLRNELCELVRKYFTSGAVLDAGCGEGYYTSSIAESIPDAEIFGIDISKTAVGYASKSCKSVFFAAASVFHIPAADSSFSMLVTMFAPYCGAEYLRVLESGGIMIMAIPSEMHLWELKKAVYDMPYKHKVKPYELDGFVLAEKKRISYNMHIESHDDIISLFQMTPYYYRTGNEQRIRLEKLNELDTQADFELLVYRKE